MDQKPVRCPLCQTLVQARADPTARELAPIRRHLARECTVRVA